VPFPFLLVEAAHLPAQSLGPVWVSGGQDLLGDILVVEKLRLAPHHVVLGGRERQPVHAEPRRPPLTQAAGPDASIPLRMMTPEEQVLQRTAVLDEADQFVDVTGLNVHGREYAAPVRHSARGFPLALSHPAGMLRT
jgi:hypothetical protein